MQNAKCKIKFSTLHFQFSTSFRGLNDGGWEGLALININHNAVDLDETLGADEDILHAADFLSGDEVAVFGIDLDLHGRGRDLELAALEEVSRVQKGALAKAFIENLVELFELLLFNTKVGERAMHRLLTNHQGLGVVRFTVRLDHRIDVGVNGADGIVAAFLAERLTQTVAEGCGLYLGRHFRCLAEYARDEVRVVFSEVTRVKKGAVDIRGAVVEGREHKAELGRGKHAGRWY